MTISHSIQYTKSALQALRSDSVLLRLTEKAGGDEKFAKSFLGALISAVSSNPKLAACSPASILSAASQAATLKLPLSPSLGYAHIIPYKDIATFQIGYKGLIQLAQRTGLYKKIRSVDVYDGELLYYNRLTGDFECGQRSSDSLVGFLAFFELLNSFQSSLYMTKDEMDKHAQLYSQSYQFDLRYNKKTSVWSKNFSSMGKKTALKLLLNTYAPLSVDIHFAIQADQAAVNSDGSFHYVDNDPDLDFFDNPSSDPELDSDSSVSSSIS